ncbi:hypothetical protein ACWD0A_29930 [Streptomyces sp. NPDC002867]
MPGTLSRAGAPHLMLRTADHPPLTSDKAGPGWAGGYSDEPPF